uniref:NADH dehydrogenase subunit 6 n=1 Tax=Modiolus philippinarum TaxID=310899 RepID=A0A1Z2WWU7_9BIVA|nr:NADH dehydrogenase subunit 6 [Modiolus philippinarum]ASB29974.1 NADH dehydrogenase subunit 6 [Modiolus philippinarum]
MSLVLFSGLSLGLCLMSLSVTESLYMGFILGSSAVTCCLVMGMKYSSLLAYFVFLIYVGGLMVLFGYVLSVFPNQKFTLSFIPFKMLFSFILVNFSFLVMKEKLPENCSYNFFIFNQVVFIYLFMGVVLLYVLLLVASMVKKRRLPLRSALIDKKKEKTPQK